MSTMDFLMRIVYAIAVGVLAWLICVFLGGLVATTDQPQLGFLGHFLIQYASVIAVVVAILAFVGGAPSSLMTWVAARRTAPRQ